MRVLVVGQGPAGMLAADWLSQLGREVVLVSSSEGSLPLWSGCWDFRNYDATGMPVADPWAWWAEPSGRPFAQAWGLDQWQRWWRALIRTWNRLGMDLNERPPSQNRWILTPSGRVRPAFLCPPWLWTAALEPAVLVGLDGLLDEPLAWMSHRFPDRWQHEVEVIRLGRPEAWRRHWTSLAWASFFDREEGEEWLLRALQPYRGRLAQGRPLVFPEVLGTAIGDGIRPRIAEELKTPVFEYSMMVPAVGGLRMRDHWRRHLKHAGVQFRHGQVTHILDRGLGVGLEDGERIEAEKVILATGGILGGGFVLMPDGRMQNSASGEGVAWPGDLNDLPRWGIGRTTGHGVLVVGRTVGGSDPDRSGDGGALNLWSVAQALTDIVGEGPIEAWLSAPQEAKP